MKLLLFGMSHLVGILQGIVADTGPASWSPITRKNAERHRLPLRPGWPNVEVSAALITPTSDFSPAFQACTLSSGTPTFICQPNLQQSLGNFLSDSGNDGVLVSLLNGHEHSILSLIQNPTPYDFVLPTHTGLPFAKDAQPLAYDVIARQVRDSITPTVQALALLRALWPEPRILHVLAPPPIESTTHILAQKEAIVGECHQFGISGPHLRQKYYLECQRQLMANLLPLSIEIVPAPPHTLTAEGFLDQTYWGDATHGNPMYGHQVFDSIVAHIGSEYPARNKRT